MTSDLKSSDMVGTVITVLVALVVQITVILALFTVTVLIAAMSQLTLTVMIDVSCVVSSR